MAELLTAKEAARLLGISVGAVYAAAKKGRLASTRAPGRFRQGQYFFDVEEVKRYAEARKNGRYGSIGEWAVMQNGEPIFTGTQNGCIAHRNTKEVAAGCGPLHGILTGPTLPLTIEKLSQREEK